MKRKLELGFWERFSHHYLTIFISAQAIAIAYISTLTPTAPNSATITSDGLIIIALVLCLVAVTTYFWLESKLLFSRIDIKLDYTSAVRVIIDTARNNKWTPTSDFSPPGKRLEFQTSNLFGSRNEIIIEIEESQVFINARGRYPSDSDIVDKIRAALTLRGHELDHQSKQ